MTLSKSGLTNRKIKGTTLVFFAQHIHAKGSYTLHELIWNAKYNIPYYFREDGITVFDLDKIDEFQIVSPSDLSEK